jgi:predicted outer membrane repeat protein
MKTLFSTLICAFASIFNLSGQSVIYVKPNATGLNNGTSWLNAYSSLHLAFQFASSGDSIFVSKGTYLPDAGSDRSASFKMRSGVCLFGGFLGLETSPTQRQLGQFPTIFSGNIGDQQDSTDNSYTILRMEKPNVSTCVDGIEFCEGFAYPSITGAGLTSDTMSGGAVYINGDTSVASPSFRNCYFHDNYARGFGGAIYLSRKELTQANPSFEQCVFENNVANQAGGALSIVIKDTSTEFTIRRCRFTNNKARLDGGALDLKILSGDHEIQIIQDTFSQNITFSRGAAAYFQTQGSHSCSLDIDSSVITSNKGQNSIITLISQDSCYIETKISDSFLGYNRDFDTLGWFLNASVTDVEYYKKDLLQRCTLTDNVHSLGSFSEGSNVIADSVFYLNNILKNPTGTVNYLPISGKGRTLHFIGNIFDNSLSRIDVSGSDTNSMFTNNIIVNCRWDLDYAFIRGRTIAHNLIANNLIAQHPINLFGSTKFVNNVFIGNRNLAGQAYVPVLPQHWTIQTPLFINNVVDIPCADLPPQLSCQYGNVYLPDTKEMVDFLGGDYRPSLCSEYINKGVTYPGMPSTDKEGKPRIADLLTDLGPYEAKSLSSDTTLSLLFGCDTVGRFAVSVPNACAPLTYHWTNENGETGTDSVGLHAGTYHLTITDRLNRNLTVQFKLASTDSLTVLVDIDSVYCGSITGGSISLNPTNGTLPYQYVWAGYPLVQTNMLSNLPAGLYIIFASDASGCSVFKEVFLPTAGSLSLLLDVEEIKCHADSTGALSAIPISGASPFSWLWNTSDTTSSLTGIVAGLYSVTVQDQVGCNAQYSFNFFEPDLISFVLSAQNASGQNQADGAATIDFLDGGVPPYKYFWSTLDTTPYLNHLLPGIYQLTVTDSNGCTIMQAIEVSYPISTVVTEGKQATLMFRPNPIDRYCTISTADNSPIGQIEIYHCAGSQVMQVNSARSTEILMFSTLDSGVYFVKQERLGLVEVQKLIVQHER